MAVEVRLSPQAQRQLADLLTMVAWESPSGARRLQDAVEALLIRISEFPHSCPAAESDPSVRMGVAARRIHVLYREREDHLLISSIVYAGYDLQRLFDE